MGKIANITEIFSSLQGEGPHTGEDTTFVRFAGCSLACRWCDTEASLSHSLSCRIETPPRSSHFTSLANPFTIEKLNDHLAYFTDPIVSLTGGEPLEQVAFLKEWLPTLEGKKKILLETNGVFAEELAEVSKHIDIISMDIKLPSSTGRAPFWNEHANFITKALASGKEFYVKIVITGDTLSKDIQEAIKLISTSNRFIPVILQPVSATQSYCHGVSAEQVESFKRICNSWLPNVSIMKQTHKEIGIL